MLEEQWLNDAPAGTKIEHTSDVGLVIIRTKSEAGLWQITYRGGHRCAPVDGVVGNALQGFKWEHYSYPQRHYLSTEEAHACPVGTLIRYDGKHGGHEQVREKVNEGTWVQYPSGLDPLPDLPDHANPREYLSADAWRVITQEEADAWVQQQPPTVYSTISLTELHTQLRDARAEIRRLQELVPTYSHEVSVTVGFSLVDLDKDACMCDSVTKVGDFIRLDNGLFGIVSAVECTFGED